MSDLLLSFVPFFALVLLGWAAGRARLLPLEGLSTLNTFVLFFGLPALLFQLGAQGALRRGWEPALLWVYGVAGAFLVLLVLTLAWRRGHGRRDAGMLALAAVFPNTGFLGLPLLARAQKEAVRPALSRTAKNVPLVSLVTLKLVLHPALVGLVGVALAAVGHPLPTSGLLTLMMAAALPSASNVSMLAEREGADTGAVARLILWTTALALLTLTLWAHALALDAGP